MCSNGLSGGAHTPGEVIADIPTRPWFVGALRSFSGYSVTVAAVVMAKAGLARRLGRSLRNYWLRSRVDAGDDCAPDVGGHVRFGDYLQSLAVEQNLLRREY
jgi:hypothetical protein